MKLLALPIVSEFLKGIMSVFLTLDGFVYSLISSAYKIFMAIAGAKLLSSEAFETIANKVYIIIGVAMLFVLAYAILKAIIDPDKMNQGKMSGGSILKSVVVAVIGLAITPVLFNLLYQAQGLILEKDVLTNLFFRSSDDSVYIGNVTDEEGNSFDFGDVKYNQAIKDVGGSITAVSVWQAVFRPAEDSGKTADDIEGAPEDYLINTTGAGFVCAGLTVAGVALAGVSFGISLIAGAAAGLLCVGASNTVNDAAATITGDKITLSEAYTYASTEGDFGIFQVFLEEWEEGNVTYLFIISTILGGFVCYAFVSFSIDMGVRAAKLAYYQIIAPIPLVLQILPNFRESFNKYLKNVLSTFLEVFVRISVVYIVVYIICHLQDLFSTETALWGNASLGSFETLIALALLIVGLVIFAKQAPKMISETFGIQSGSMSLGIGKKLADGGAFTAGAAIGGAITTTVRSLTHRYGTKENWQNKNRKVTVGSALKNTAGGLLSGVAGGVSGGVRSGYNARKATSIKDMASSASSGAKAAVDRRDEREKYAAEHANAAGKPTIWSVSKGHISDAALKVVDWAGINSVEANEKENQAISQVAAKKKAVGDQAKSAITSNSAKRKEMTLGVDSSRTYSNALINKAVQAGFTGTEHGHQLTEYNTEVHHYLNKMLDQARAAGGKALGLTVDEWSDLLGDYEFKFGKEVQNVALMTKKNRDRAGAISDKNKAALKDVIIAADELRDELKKNLGSSYFEQANLYDENGVRSASTQDLTLDTLLNENLDLVDGDTALSRLGDKMDIKYAENQRIITEARKKREEKNNK